MKLVFADTFYFLAVFNPDDQYHQQTRSLSKQMQARYLTTECVLVEMADAMANVFSRSKVSSIVAGIHASPQWEIAAASSVQLQRALQFYDQHRDKAWTLTDCTSFLIMRERGITEALTGDRHFEQAGFIALLK